MSTPVAAHLSRSSSPDFQGRRERVYRPVLRKSDTELFYTRRELMAISAPWAENIKMRLALLSCPEIVARKPQDSTERPMQQRERLHDNDENEERRRGGGSGSRRRDDSRIRGEDERRKQRSLERSGGAKRGGGEEGGEPVTRGRSSERIIVVTDSKRTTTAQQIRARQDQLSREPSRRRNSNRACSRSSVMARRESRVRERQAQNGWR